MMNSIRRTLLVALIVGMSLVMLIGAYATYRVAQNEANEIFDYYLRQIALSLRDPRFRFDPSMAIPDEKDLDVVIRIWNLTGVTVYYSHPHRNLPTLTRLGYSTVATRDGPWRVYAIQDLGETIEVAQPLEARNDKAASAALRILIPYLFLLPLLGVIIWIIINRGLRPLTQLTGAVLARTPDSLEPLHDTRGTRELQPLIAALNDLLARLHTALAAQRAFIADAAHELRTPLTALQLQLQLLERAATDAERTAALNELKAGLQRATHVVSQLLTLARQDPAVSPAAATPLDLVAVVREVIVEHQTLAQAKHIDLGLPESISEAELIANPDALRVMLTNLIGNAVRYTPSGGKVDVQIGRDDSLYITICDNGPGIPEQDLLRVFDRFYRRPGHDDTGSGLGLAIVKSIAERLQARVSLHNRPQGGLCARVEFTAAPAQK